MTGVRLAELLGRLSLVLDIANDWPYGKAVRSVVLAVELGRLAGATNEELHDTFWVSLLSYLGCTGFAREEELAGDDGADLDRFQRAICDTSTKLAEIVGAGPRILSALGQLSERWVSRDSLALPMRLREIGHIGETAHQQHGRAGAIALIRKRAGAQLDPRLAMAFVEGQAALFTAIEHTQIFDRFLGLESKPLAYADEHRIDDVARALAIFADLKCPIFSGHSTGVAALAERAAIQLGLGADDIRTLRWAALLHDIGRVGVPSAIWNRRGPLDWAEAEQVRLHAYYTERLLSPISALRSVAEIAAAAHERLDGAGYPRRGPARLLLPGARVLAAADMAFAMSEPRPHREALSPDAIARELCAEVSEGRLDAAAATAVLASFGVSARVAPRRVRGLSERELEVCCLIARGKMNKEIAELLGITFRTVQNHVYHIFEKLGVHSRSGVAVWLVENDLVQ